MDNLITIIIPAHNECVYINNTISSLLQQTYNQFEIIIVTNGCTDSTDEKVKNIISTNENFNIVHKSLETANVSKARNEGANLAKGELLFFLDADTTLEKEGLKVIANNFNKSHSFGATRVVPDKKGFSFNVFTNWKNFLHKTKLYKGSSGAMICWKKEFLEVGGFNENKNIMEIKDIRKKLLKFGKYIYLNTTVTTSMRRYQKWGLLGSIWFWIVAWIKAKTNKEQYEVIR